MTLPSDRAQKVVAIHPKSWIYKTKNVSIMKKQWNYRISVPMSYISFLYAYYYYIYIYVYIFTCDLLTVNMILKREALKGWCQYHFDSIGTHCPDVIRMIECKKWRNAINNYTLEYFKHCSGILSTSRTRLYHQIWPNMA